MENNEDENLMINHNIELDISKLPKLMQNTIADLAPLMIERRQDNDNSKI